MDVVPVEVFAGVVAQRVLPPPVVVLLAAVSAAGGLAARAPRLSEPACRRWRVGESREGRVEVEEEEGAVGRVERGEHGLERRVVLRGSRVGQRVAAAVVERLGEERRAPQRVQVGDHHPAHPDVVAQPPELLPELAHHRRDVRDRGLRTCQCKCQLQISDGNCCLYSM